MVTFISTDEACWEMLVKHFPLIGYMQIPSIVTSVWTREDSSMSKGSWANVKSRQQRVMMIANHLHIYKGPAPFLNRTVESIRLTCTSYKCIATHKPITIFLH